MDQKTGEAGTGDVGDRFGESQLAVGFDDVLHDYERGQIGLIADVEDHGKDTGERADDIEVRHVQAVQDGCQRYGSQKRGAGEVGGDQDGTAAQTICPGSGEEAEDKDSGAAGCGKKSHLNGGRTKDKGGSEGNADAGNGGSDLGDRLAAPEFEEIAVAAEAAEKHLYSVTRHIAGSRRRTEGHRKPLLTGRGSDCTVAARLGLLCRREFGERVR